MNSLTMRNATDPKRKTLNQVPFCRPSGISWSFGSHGIGGDGRKKSPRKYAPDITYFKHEIINVVEIFLTTPTTSDML